VKTSICKTTSFSFLFIFENSVSVCLKHLKDLLSFASFVHNRKYLLAGPQPGVDNAPPQNFQTDI